MTDGDAERRILLLIGAVGAGKGTQAAILSQKLGVPHLSSGELFRRALREGSELGERAREYMERGELVPDEITIGMFMDELAAPAAARGAILDGFPRTRTQAEALDATLASQGERISLVVYIEVPPEELVARVSGRWVCPTCGTPYHEKTDPPRTPGICDRDGTPLVQRDDDRAEVFRSRLEKQIPPMHEVVQHYDEHGVVTRVDGRRPIDEVTGTILEALAEAVA
ncbi:MAG TPA: adenylate kinase [Candidatus Limnocylindria bacterium]|nr:adenylate kinase [Candidatus Limnocylindria bacterium]